MRVFAKSWIPILLAWVCLTLSGIAHADGLADYERARNDYDAGRYAQAADRFQAMVAQGTGSAANDPVLLEQARMYYAACLIALGKDTEANEAIRGVLLANPSARPDPVVFPRAVADRFTDVREKIRAALDAKAMEDSRKKRQQDEELKAAREAEKERIRQLEKLASQEVHVSHNSRWIAAIPFGVGQFQNGHVAGGWLFLLSEVALTATTVVTSMVLQNLESQGFKRGVDTIALNSRVNNLHTLNIAAFAGLMTVASVGVLHAQLTFVPEVRTIRSRPLPPAPVRVAPSVGIAPGGGFLGLSGSF
jgi:tetratricopeptide (TPR) repeat protein